MVGHADAAAALATSLDVQASPTYGSRAWGIGTNNAWDRGFSRADRKRFGDEPVPESPIIAVTVGDLLELIPAP